MAVNGPIVRPAWGQDPMSAGRLRTLARPWDMSALPQKANIEDTRRDVG